MPFIPFFQREVIYTGLNTYEFGITTYQLKQAKVNYKTQVLHLVNTYVQRMARMEPLLQIEGPLYTVYVHRGDMERARTALAPYRDELESYREAKF